MTRHANGLGLPSYDQLPPAPSGGRTAWGLFGPDDSVGLLNLQTPERVVAAARLVQTGEVFSLNAPHDAIDPPFFSRRPARLTVFRVNRSGFDDYLDDFYPQASSQWDSLGHIGYERDIFYNGASPDDIENGRCNTIEHWAARGIAGRGVLLDIEELLGGAGEGFDPVSNVVVTADDLDRARRRAGIVWEPGDVLVLHTGFLAWYRHLPSDEKARLAEPGNLQAVGLDHEESVARYLWDSGVSAVVSDNPAVEVYPPQRDEKLQPFGFLHRCLIGQFGMALGELWWLADLAQSCRNDGRNEFLLVSAPAHVLGSVGSPANALAIK